MSESELSLSELCRLFCCPPIPTKIANKLLFLPPIPTYEIKSENIQSESQISDKNLIIEFKEASEWFYDEVVKRRLEVFYVTTRKGNRIICMYIPFQGNASGSFNNSNFTILYSNGNTMDIGLMANFYVGFAEKVRCNIFAYDYSGYGQSTGKPSEENLYADIEAAYQSLLTRYKLSPKNIILYGSVFGTAPSIHLAATGGHDVAGVVLQTPFKSALRVAFPHHRQNSTSSCFDSLKNIDRIPKLITPVLIIHGTEDAQIDFSHGLDMYDKCPTAVEPLWIEGCARDVELYECYLERLNRFIHEELKVPSSP